jgi:hypothetical protein
MTLSDQRDPVPRRGGARRFRPPPPAGVELPPPASAGGPGWPAQTLAPGAPQTVPAPRQRPVGNGSPIGAPAGDPRAPYVRQLEAQLQSLSETVRTLEQQLAGYAHRNQELEASHMRLASYRAESERTVAQRAAETIRSAESQAQQVTAAAQARAARLEQEARTQAMDLIEAIGAEIDALERSAEQYRSENAGDGGEPSARGATKTGVESLSSEAGAPEEAELARVRGGIADLLKLREAILLNIRGAVHGFEQQLAELEKPPLAVAGEGEAGERGQSGDVGEVHAEAGAAAAQAAPTGPSIELEATPVDGVLAASRIEGELAAVGGDAHLRSLEGNLAKLQVHGVSADQLTAALSSRFPGSKAKWDGESRVRLTLPPAVVPPPEPAPAAEADDPETDSGAAAS